ncbi:MAG: prepilin-type N-terminal cleavage/methylation domain-containing protein [Candidatus Paceibacterota bacterium]|jgi:prepilin-type N-terminal cleavage/methylation domain-containing protein
MNRIQKGQKGFTLLELLVIIAIIAVLSVVSVIVINPTQTLQEARDLQRISDLAMIKSAFGIYLTTTSSPQLDGITGIANDRCDGGSKTNKKLWVSVPSTITTITDARPPIEWTSSTTSWGQSMTVASSTVSNGTGWIPVNFDGILRRGSPISSFPLDPTNTVTATEVTNSDLMYRYACKKFPLSYEVNAKLESTEYTINDNYGSKDGGNNATLYEVGNDLSILPSTNDF